MTHTKPSSTSVPPEPVPHHGLLYTPAEERFDRITRLAQQALSVPVAAVMLINDGKQWFKAIAGWNVSELPEERALCSWAFESDGPTVIDDMQQDARSANHAFVTGAPRFRFCAIYPLLDQNGWPVGGFCVFDVKPRTLTATEQQSVLDLAELAQRELLADRVPSPDASLATTLSIVRREGMIDPLTRVWNRRGAYVLASNAFAKADRQDESLGIAIVDVEGFKRINERHGHQTGDEVLRSVATRLVSAVRGLDLVFRLVDDRFLLLMADVHRPTAEKALERVRWAVSGTAIPCRSGTLPISVATGLMVRAPNDDARLDTLLAHVEQTMQQSKSAESAGALEARR